MGRVSKAQAAENRERVVATAARMFREQGIDGVSVADLMAEAGLTHGGFYKQFASKEALVAEAVRHAFAQRADNPADESRAAFIDHYLSPAHRDSPGRGCPCAGFGGDLTHGPQEATAVFAAGLEADAQSLGGTGEPDLAAMSMLVGAMILARATKGTDTSDRVLRAARAALLATP